MPSPNRHCAPELADALAAAIPLGSDAVAEPVLTPIAIEAFAYESLSNWSRPPFPREED